MGEVEHLLRECRSFAFSPCWMGRLRVVEILSEISAFVIVGHRRDPTSRH